MAARQTWTREGRRHDGGLRREPAASQYCSERALSNHRFLKERPGVDALSQRSARRLAGWAAFWPQIAHGRFSHCCAVGEAGHARFFIAPTRTARTPVRCSGYATRARRAGGLNFFLLEDQNGIAFWWASPQTPPPTLHPRPQPPPHTHTHSPPPHASSPMDPNPSRPPRRGCSSPALANEHYSNHTTLHGRRRSSRSFLRRYSKMAPTTTETMIIVRARPPILLRCTWIARRHRSPPPRLAS